MSTQLFSISKVAQIIDVSTNTIKRWYKWYESPEYTKPKEIKLPSYTVDNRGTKLFKFSAIAQLEKFKQDLQSEYKGCMSEFNAHWQWGQRGTKILENKKKKQEEKEKEDGNK